MDPFELGLRTLLIVVFAAAAAGKLRSRSALREFRGGLAAFGVRGRRAAALAVCVPVAELAATGLLAVDRTAVAGYAVAAVLLVAFTAALAAALRAGRRVSCRCFGARASSAGPLHLVRNGVLLAAAVSGGLLQFAGLAPAGVAAAGAAAALGAFAALVVIRLDDLAYLLGSRPRLT
jgi:hypothetical protein